MPSTRLHNDTLNGASCGPDPVDRSVSPVLWVSPWSYIGLSQHHPHLRLTGSLLRDNTFDCESRHFLYVPGPHRYPPSANLCFTHQILPSFSIDDIFHMGFSDRYPSIYFHLCYGRHECHGSALFHSCFWYGLG